MKIRHLLPGAIALAGALAAPAAAPAQTTQFVQIQDDGWLAWHGCWHGEGAPAGELLCIVPDAGGVRLITTARGAIVAESRVITDGSARPVRHDDCSGVELARWSADGHRVFLTSDLTCQGSTRQASGIFVFVSPAEWLSVQAINSGGQVATRTIRYTSVEAINVPRLIIDALRSTRAERMTARQAALAPIAESDVNEAAGYVDPNAVQEWLRATNLPYQLAGNASDVTYGDAIQVSALDQVGRMSTGVSYAPREVEVIERPVYVNRTIIVGGYYGGYYYRHYWPWYYGSWGWHVVPKPLIVIRTPIVIHRGTSGYWSRTNWGRSAWDGNRYRSSGWSNWGTRASDDRRSGSWDGRNWNDRNGSDRNWSDRSRGGSVTRGGYSRDRDRSSSGSRDAQRVSPRSTTTRSSTTQTASPRQARPRSGDRRN